MLFVLGAPISKNANRHTIANRRNNRPRLNEELNSPDYTTCVYSTSITLCDEYTSKVKDSEITSADQFFTDTYAYFAESATIPFAAFVHDDGKFLISISEKKVDPTKMHIADGAKLTVSNFPSTAAYSSFEISINCAFEFTFVEDDSAIEADQMKISPNVFAKYTNIQFMLTQASGAQTIFALRVFPGATFDSDIFSSEQVIISDPSISVVFWLYIATVNEDVEEILPDMVDVRYGTSIMVNDVTVDFPKSFADQVSLIYIYFYRYTYESDDDGEEYITLISNKIHFHQTGLESVEMALTVQCVGDSPEFWFDETFDSSSLRPFVDLATWGDEDAKLLDDTNEFEITVYSNNAGLTFIVDSAKENYLGITGTELAPLPYESLKEPEDTTKTKTVCVYGSNKNKCDDYSVSIKDSDVVRKDLNPSDNKPVLFVEDVTISYNAFYDGSKLDITAAINPVYSFPTIASGATLTIGGLPESLEVDSCRIVVEGGLIIQAPSGKTVVKIVTSKLDIGSDLLKKCANLNFELAPVGKQISLFCHCWDGSKGEFDFLQSDRFTVTTAAGTQFDVTFGDIWEAQTEIDFKDTTDNIFVEQGEQIVVKVNDLTFKIANTLGALITNIEFYFNRAGLSGSTLKTKNTMMKLSQKGFAETVLRLLISCVGAESSLWFDKTFDDATLKPFIDFRHVGGGSSAQILDSLLGSSTWELKLYSNNKELTFITEESKTAYKTLTNKELTPLPYIVDDDPFPIWAIVVIVIGAVIVIAAIVVGVLQATKVINLCKGKEVSV